MSVIESAPGLPEIRRTSIHDSALVTTCHALDVTAAEHVGVELGAQVFLDAKPNDVSITLGWAANRVTMRTSAGFDMAAASGLIVRHIAVPVDREQGGVLRGHACRVVFSLH